MLYAQMLFAQLDDTKAELPAKPEGSGLFNFMPVIAIVALFYLLIIMPGRKERQQRQTMMNALKRNDRVITSGGIIGVVVNIREGTDEVTIKSEDTKLLILRSSIARIITEPDKDKETSAQPKPAP